MNYKEVQERLHERKRFETKETIEILRALQNEMDKILKPIRNKFDTILSDMSSMEGVLKLCIADDYNKKHKLRKKVNAQYVSFGDWECEKSPTKKCIYGFEDDYANDKCIFCGKPEERK